MADVKKYIEELAQAAGVSDDQKQAFLQALDNAKFAKAIDDGILRHDDYSRNMDTLRADKEKFEKEKTGYSDWYKQSLAAFEKNKQVVAQYEQQYGPLDGSDPKLVASPTNAVTKEELQKAMDEYSGKAVFIAKKAAQVSVDYFKRFNEPLDMDAFEKFALEKGLPIDAAYDAFIRPRVSELDQKNIDERIKAAKEEGLREGRSQSNLPVDTAPKAPHPFFDRPKPDAATGGTKLRDSFVSAWNTAAVGTQK